MKSKKKIFKNGLRLITVPMKDHSTVTVLVMSETGSINEKKEKHGIAHFLEHMVMKGGERYKTAYEVSSTLDSVGAYSNAFTGQEYTGYYAKGNPKHLSVFMDVVSDMYLTARLEEVEINKEKGVIVQEINMYKDKPSVYVQDLYYKAVYGDQPAGRHPLGTKETVNSLTREDFTSFMKKHYVASNTIVVVAGNIDQRNVENEVLKRFGEMPFSKSVSSPRVVEKQEKPQFLIENKKTDQLHINMGVRAFKASDKRVPTLMVLNSVLGGGMSGRLFQKLREEMGACYYIRSVADLSRKSGLLTVMVGIDPKRLGEVMDAVLNEMRKLKDEPVGEKELKKTKEHIVGRRSLGLESSDSVAEFFVDQEVLTKTQKTPALIAKEIKAVTSEDVKKLARFLFKDNRLSAAVVGKNPDTKTLKNKLTF